MHHSLRRSTVLLAAAALVACGGNPQPQTQPEPQADADSAAEARADSMARADSIRRARERAADAEQLCRDAQAAVTAGNYENARELYERARNEYGGTECAERASTELDRLDRIETLRQRIHFEFDRSAITDSAAGVLRRKAEILRNNPSARIVIEGHCDERGSNEYNMALGQRRANAAREYLLELGVPEQVIARTVSYGEERPLVNRSTERAWSMNRRSEFVIRDVGDL